MPDLNQAYHEVLKRVTSLGRYWKRMLILSGVLRWLARSAAVLSGLVLLDLLLPGGERLQLLGILAFLGLSLWWLYHDLIRSTLTNTSIPQVATHVERAYPGSENRILSAIELWPEAPRAQYGYSQDFLQQLMHQAHEISTGLDPRLVFVQERQQLRHAIRWFAGSLLLCIGLLVVFPTTGGSLIDALGAFRQLPAHVTGAQILQVKPGNAEVPAHEDVTIQAEIVGHMTDAAHVRVVWRGPDAAAENTDATDYEMRPGDSGLYETVLRNLTQPLEYTVVAGDAKSPTFRVSLRRPPALQQLQLTLHLPEYTGLTPQQLETGTGNVQTLIGTRVELQAESSMPLAEATLDFASEKQVALAVDGTQFRGEFQVEANDSYTIRLKDHQGSQNPDPVRYTVNAVDDEHPRVEVLEPGRDIVLDDLMMVYLNILAQDDYGVIRGELVYTHEGTGETTRVPLAMEKPSPMTALQYNWDIDLIGLFPEEVLTYYIEVWDNDTVRGPKSGRSASYRVRHPSLAELYSELEEQQLGEQAAMEEILGDQREAHSAIDDLIDELRKSQELTWKEEKAIEQVMKTQEQIREKAEEIVQQLQQTAEEMQEKQLFDPETVEQYQELQKLMDEALTEDQKQIMEKLREALQEQQISEQEKDLLEANFNQDEFRQRLERMIELYKQMLVQQKLEAVAKQAKELYEQQQAATEQIQEYSESQQPDPQAMRETSRREEQLSEQLGKLEQEIEAVADEIRELPNQERVADEVDRLQKESRDRQTAQTLQQAGQKLQQQQMEQSLQDAQQATGALNDLQQGLDNALEFMKGGNADAAMAELQNAVREGLQLSRQHESDMKQSTALAKQARGELLEGELRRIQELAVRQLSIAQGAGILAERLWELGKEQMLVDPKIVWRLRAAQDEISRSARALEDRKPNSALPMQHQALSDINMSVRDMLKAMDQMNQQMNAGGLQNMLDQLEQLAENQSQLNEMAQQLGQQMRREGRVPGMDQMMKRMSYEQSLIREATERLAENMDKLSQTLGNLKDVSEEMKEVEAELEQGKLDDQVLEKQRRILTRMLESAKSLQKRQTSKERKSESVSDTTLNRDAPALDADLQTIQQQLEASVRSGANEEWPETYRELIRQYYRALSQRTQPAN